MENPLDFFLRSADVSIVKVYKLTDEDGKTRNNTQWGPGVSHEGTGEGSLCGPGWIHWYHHPLLAVFLNPIHADFSEPRLWDACTAGKCLDDDGLKGGSQKLTTLREIPLPEVTTEQRVKFAILCALEVCDDAKFRSWAKNWLSGGDRSEEAAWAAWAADSAARAAAWAAWAAARAARAAARAADSAAWAAARAAADSAAVEAAYAVEAAVGQPKSINLVALAEKAMEL